MFRSKKCNDFSGLKVISRDIHLDNRGYFLKIFDQAELKKFGWKGSIKQINLSETYERGSVRGMHMQLYPFSEFKLITCIRGSVFDVVLDLRKNSKSFLKYYSIELNQEDNKSLLVPPGFAHGFQALEDKSQLIYAHSKEYKKDFESGCNLNDPAINIRWPLKLRNLSEKDIQLPLVKDIKF
tara:strand:+ start:2334 stop:2879 length:546 start_codon:yes stop_codon:yes gene_type:complete